MESMPFFILRPVAENRNMADLPQKSVDLVSQRGARRKDHYPETLRQLLFGNHPDVLNAILIGFKLRSLVDFLSNCQLIGKVWLRLEDKDSILISESTEGFFLRLPRANPFSNAPRQRTQVASNRFKQKEKNLA